MSRNMSVTLTEQAVVERRKTVTRRLGWWKTKKGVRILQPGDRLTLCRKVMGRRHLCGCVRGLPCRECGGAGFVVDPLVRLAEVEIVDVRREPLCFIDEDDVRREGVDPSKFGRISNPPPDVWVRWFCAEQGVTPDTTVTRIEWRYLDEADR